MKRTVYNKTIEYYEDPIYLNDMLLVHDGKLYVVATGAMTPTAMYHHKNALEHGNIYLKTIEEDEDPNDVEYTYKALEAKGYKRS